MIGYKLIASNNAFRFIEGVTYELPGPAEPLVNGFEFCDVPVGLVSRSSLEQYAMVEALGDIQWTYDTRNERVVLATNKLKIIRFLTKEELHQEGKNKIYDVVSGKYFFEKNKLHRDDDLPAKITANGDQFWYQRGVLHREGDLPAVMFANGKQMWFQEGEIHRDHDLPAEVMPNGTQCWYKRGKLQERMINLPWFVHREKSGIKMENCTEIMIYRRKFLQTVTKCGINTENCTARKDYQPRCMQMEGKNFI
jgi:hypothetical protein